jgi:Autographiviridae endonuclease VII
MNICRKCNTAKASAWNKANTNARRLNVMKYRYKIKYGITIEQRDQLFRGQGSRCGCCGSLDGGPAYGWAVDHCHATGKVRGVVCSSCNTMLGFAKDSAERLQAGINYLNKARP